MNPLFSERTYVGVGGPAPFLLEPGNRGELAAAAEALAADSLPFRILGGGSNLLVDDAGVPEAVVSTRRLARLYRFAEEAGALVLGVEAGASLARLVSFCRKEGLTGAEPLVGIPGTVGGAAVMNAGGRHGDIGRLITSAVVLDAEGTLKERGLRPEDFGYRRSVLRGSFVVEVRLRLERGDRDAIWEKMSAVLKEKRATQPLLEKSCGCVFKNPAGGKSAGALLDVAGMKGERIGGAEVSSVHANFIVNRGGATCRDYRALMEEGRRRVKRAFGVLLEPEVEIW